jgi:fructose-specific phosphotransferase system IIC component
MTTNNNEDGLRGLAVASIICGVASWFVLAVVLAPMGTIFAVLAMKAKDSSTKTLAIVGLVIGIVSLMIMFAAMSILIKMR